MTRRPPPGRRPAPSRGPRGADPRRRPGSATLPRLILAAFGVLAIGVFIGVMSIYASFTSDLPDIGEIENFSLDQASTVVSADGKEASRLVRIDQVIPPGVGAKTRYAARQMAALGC